MASDYVKQDSELGWNVDADNWLFAWVSILTLTHNDDALAELKRLSYARI